MPLWPNAGPGNVNKWIKNMGHLGFDEFVESIPFDETRDYVKRVLRSMHIYGSHYNENYFNETRSVALMKP